MIADPVLTHEEAAQLVVDLVDNNRLGVTVGDRTFWAVPNSGTTTVVTPTLTATSTSAALSSSAQIGIIVGGIVIAAVALLVGLIFYRRRKHRNRVHKTSSILTSMNQSRTNGRDIGRDIAQLQLHPEGVINPLFQTDAHSGDDGGYQDVTVLPVNSGAFSNPMYASGPFAVPMESSSDYDPYAAMTHAPIYDMGASYAVSSGDGRIYNVPTAIGEENHYSDTTYDGQYFTVPGDDGGYMHVNGVGDQEQGYLHLDGLNNVYDHPVIPFAPAAATDSSTDVQYSTNNYGYNTLYRVPTADSSTDADAGYLFLQPE